MQFLKNHMKQIGTLITIAALFFVVWKMVHMDVDYAAFASPQAIFILIGSILLQAMIFCYMTFPWLHLVRILSGKKISGRQALPVYTKANLMKYIPGNVFQYVARNQLAAEAKISHVDVALATVIDIGMSMLAPFLLSILLMRKQIFTVLSAYRNSFLLIFFFIIIILAGAFLFVRWKWKESLHRYLDKYRRLLNRETILQLLAAFSLYLLQSVFSVALYALPLLGFITVPIEKIPQFLGAYLFSWIVGFITPGSPGGIGVREAVMLLLCSSFLDESTIVLYVVLMRLASTCADVVAFGFGVGYRRWNRRHERASNSNCRR